MSRKQRKSRYRKSYLVFIILSFIVVFPNFSVAGGNYSFSNRSCFETVKRTLLTEVYKDNRFTFYCGCPFTIPDKRVLHTNGYKSNGASYYSKQLWFEHIVPAENFGRSFKEWKTVNAHDLSEWSEKYPECTKPGRDCATKVNAEFRRMLCDMYNLVPSVGEVNYFRKNYRFDMVTGQYRTFGSCKAKIGIKKFEPPLNVRGDIARTYFYMDKAYRGRGIIGGKSRRLFKAWDKQDPVDQWECTRAKRIQSVQGNTNDILKKRCVEKNYW